MREWFARLNQREQTSLLALALAVGLYLLYMLLWSPLAGSRDALADQNRAVAASVQRVDGMVSEILQLREGSAPGAGQRNLAALINQSTGQWSLAVSRLQPNSRGEVQVRLENAAFDDLIAWLHGMEYREGLLVREVSITRAAAPGRVDATVRLGQAR